MRKLWQRVPARLRWYALTGCAVSLIFVMLAISALLHAEWPTAIADLSAAIGWAVASISSRQWHVIGYRRATLRLTLLLDSKSADEFAARGELIARELPWQEGFDPGDFGHNTQ